MDVLNYTLPPLLNANMNVLQTCRAGEHTACLGDIEYKSLDGKTKTGEFAGRYQMSGILNNGMTFTLGLPNGGWAYSDNWPLNIDINGQSGPNIVGRDAFLFMCQIVGLFVLEEWQMRHLVIINIILGIIEMVIVVLNGF